MRSSVYRVALVVGVMSMAAFLLSGCATPQLRGTPYYSTESDPDPSAAKERIPLWPIVYYRSPTLSVLWPLFEKSDEFMALRPLASVYGLDQQKQTYSLLWPLGQFDRVKKENRFFPLFWGENHAAAFPLYWHFNHPLGPGGGLDALIPLWWYSADQQGYSFNLLWPFVNVKKQAGSQGWRVWPLMGSYSDKGGAYYRFAVWPFAHQWASRASRERGEAVLPLYLRYTSPDERYFVSLPYSRRRGGGTQWDLVLPLYYSSREGDRRIDALFPMGWRSSDRQGYSFNLLWPFVNVQKRGGAQGWRVWPLMGSYADQAGNYYRFAAWPFAHQWASCGGGERGEVVLPLYLRHTSTDGRYFVSLPYSRRRGDGREWDLVLPLCYSSREGDRRMLITPLGGVRRDTNGMGWVALPVLCGGRSTKSGRDTWILGPLAHFGESSATSNRHVFPLFYSRADESGRTFLSLPWSSGSSRDGGDWQLIPPLMLRTAKGGDHRLLTPIYSAGTRRGGADSWQTLVPLWYRSQDAEGKLVATLLGGWHKGTDGRNWLIWPLLSGGRRGSDWRDLWVVAPMFHARWDQAGLSHHLLPLYWWDAHDKTLLSPAVSKWENEATGRKTTLVPPALTLYSSEPEKKDLWALGGVAHFSWGENAGSSHVLPLYWWSGRDKTLISPLVSQWADPAAGRKTTALPLALTLYSSEPEKKDLWALGGAAHFSWGEKAGSSHVLPLYYRDRSEGLFLSVPWSSWTWNRTATNTLIAPALSWMTRQEKRNDLWVVGPLAHFSWGERAGSSHVLPLFYRNKEDDAFISLPYCHWVDERAARYLYPPLLTMYTREGTERQLDALLGLFSERWGTGPNEGYFIPVYYHEGWERFYTIAFGWNRDAEDGFFYPLTPLVGIRTGKHSGGWVFPLWSRDRDPATKRVTGNILWGRYAADGRSTESSLLPLYSYRNRGAEPPVAATHSSHVTYGKTFWSLPAIWYRNTVDVKPLRGQRGRAAGTLERSSARDNGFFPLWSYTHLTTARGEEEKYGSLLLFLYDFKSVRRQAPSVNQPQDEHVKRILWRFYYYSRNDENVSVDIFPAITYDRLKDGFRRWSFLWRAFRYERGPEGKKLDILFVPLMRSAASN